MLRYKEETRKTMMFRSTIKLKIEAKSKEDADMIINVLMGHGRIFYMLTG